MRDGLSQSESLAKRAADTYPDARSRIRQTAQQAWEKALGYYSLGERPLPEIDFSLRGRVAAQAAWQVYRRGRTQTIGGLRLRFNLQAYQLNPADMLYETIPHEVAHLITALHWGAGCRPHGSQWRQVMQECFNLAPRRTHQLPLAPSKTLAKRFIYACNCREHALTGIRHRRIVRGIAAYLCKDCSTRLHYQNIIAETQIPSTQLIE